MQTYVMPSEVLFTQPAPGMGQNHKLTNIKGRRSKVSLKVSVARLGRYKSGHTLSFTRSNNNCLAKMLEKKKQANKKLIQQNRMQKQELIQHRIAINHLLLENETLKAKLDKICTSLTNTQEELIEKLLADNNKLMAELKQMQNTRKCKELEDILANTAHIEQLKVEGDNINVNEKNSAKSPAVHLVRPMKCGYIVGNPVVSLHRMRRASVQQPLAQVPEGEEPDSSPSYSSEESEENEAVAPGGSVPIPSPPSELQDESITFARPPLRRGGSSNTRFAGTRGRRRYAQSIVARQVRQPDIISESQQLQLSTPCRVQLQDCRNTPSSSTASNTIFSSPMLPVVLLNRVVTQRKARKFVPSSENEDEANSSATVMHDIVDEVPMDISNLDVPLALPTVVKNLTVNLVNISPKVVQQNSASKLVPQSDKYRINRSLERRLSRQQDNLQENSNDSNMVIQKAQKEPTAVTDLSVTENQQVEKSQKCEVENINSEESSEEDTLTAEDQVEMNAADPELKVESKPRKEKTKPMPLSMKLILESKIKKRKSSDSNNTMEERTAKKLAKKCEDLEGEPGIPNMVQKNSSSVKVINNPSSKTESSKSDNGAEVVNSKPSTRKTTIKQSLVKTESNENEGRANKVKEKPCPKSKKKFIQESPSKYDSESLDDSFKERPVNRKQLISESSSSTDTESSRNSMSPEERQSYMEDFYRRLSQEDPMEGTSRSFKVQKKSVTRKNSVYKIRTKFLRSNNKKNYTEEELSDESTRSVTLDNSWHPNGDKVTKQKGTESKKTKAPVKKTKKKDNSKK